MSADAEQLPRRSSAPRAAVRVLVVSVEPQAARELSRSFAQSSLGGHVDHVTDAEEAIVAAADNPPDVVVTEPRVFGGSGNAVLGRFKRDFPGVVRVLLLDDGRDGAALAALDNFHRVLYRPLESRALIDVIDSVRDVREMLEDPALAEAIGRIGRLPPPPRLSMELLRRTEDLEAGAREITDLVERDPTLAAKVLRLSNSAMYNSGRRIRDIHSAVVWLGQLTLRRLVLAGEVYSAARFFGSDAANGERLRRDSLLASRLAARLLPGPEAELAGTAALLAQVGRLLPNVGVPWERIEVGERRLSYADAGAYLLGLWGLPLILVAAAAFHPQPEAAGEPDFGVIGATHVAWALIGDLPLDMYYLESRGLDQQLERWQQILEDVRAEED